MDFLTTPLLAIEEYNQALNSLKNYTMPVNISGPSDSQKVHLTYSICEHLKCKGIFIAYNEMHARKLYEDFTFFADESVVFFPAKEIMLYDVEAKSYDAIFQRIKALDRILSGKYRFIVTSVEAISQKLVPRDLFLECTLSFKIGDKIQLGELSQKLVTIGYERVEVVEGKGQFAIRGGIIDIFSIASENAYRMELFDDEIDSIRSFDLMSQRSVEKLESMKVIPAREVIYTAEKRASIISSIKNELKEHIQKLGKKNNQEHGAQLVSKVEADIEKLKSDYYFPGLDRYIPFIIDTPSDLMQYAGDGNLIFVDELLRFKQRSDNVVMEYMESCKSFMEKGGLLPKMCRSTF